MTRRHEVFREVEFAGDLTGRGALKVRQGALTLRRRGLLWAWLLGTVVVVLAILAALLLLGWRPETGGRAVIGIGAAILFFTVVIAARVFLVVPFLERDFRRVVTADQYDVSPPIETREGQADELQFVARGTEGASGEFVIRFARPGDAQHCYEIFTSQKLPQQSPQ